MNNNTVNASQEKAPSKRRSSRNTREHQNPVENYNNEQRPLANDPDRRFTPPSNVGPFIVTEPRLEPANSSMPSSRYSEGHQQLSSLNMNLPSPELVDDTPVHLREYLTSRNHFQNISNMNMRPAGPQFLHEMSHPPSSQNAAELAFRNQPQVLQLLEAVKRNDISLTVLPPSGNIRMSSSDPPSSLLLTRLTTDPTHRLNSDSQNSSSLNMGLLHHDLAHSTPVYPIKGYPPSHNQYSNRLNMTMRPTGSQFLDEVSHPSSSQNAASESAFRKQQPKVRQSLEPVKRQQSEISLREVPFSGDSSRMSSRDARSSLLLTPVPTHSLSSDSQNSSRLNMGRPRLDFVDNAPISNVTGHNRHSPHPSNTTMGIPGNELPYDTSISPLQSYSPRHNQYSNSLNMSMRPSAGPQSLDKMSNPPLMQNLAVAALNNQHEIARLLQTFQQNLISSPASNVPPSHLLPTVPTNSLTSAQQVLELAAFFGNREPGGFLHQMCSKLADQYMRGNVDPNLLANIQTYISQMQNQLNSSSDQERNLLEGTVSTRNNPQTSQSGKRGKNARNTPTCNRNTIPQLPLPTPKSDTDSVYSHSSNNMSQESRAMDMDTGRQLSDSSSSASRSSSPESKRTAASSSILSSEGFHSLTASGSKSSQPEGQSNRPNRSGRSSVIASNTNTNVTKTADPNVTLKGNHVPKPEGLKTPSHDMHSDDLPTDDLPTDNLPSGMNSRIRNRRTKLHPMKLSEMKEDSDDGIPDDWV